MAAPASVRSPLESLLKDEERTRFAKWLCGRIKTVGSAMTEFLAKRDQYAKEAEDDFSWRSAGAEGRAGRRESNDDDALKANDIFDLQNDSLNMVGSAAEFMGAKIGDEIVGTSPFFSLRPEGIEDKELADSIQKHFEWKLEKTRFKAATLAAIKLACDLGEGVMKLTWETEVDVSETTELVAHVDGEPLLGIAGDYVYEQDLVPCEDAPDSLALMDDPAAQMQGAFPSPVAMEAPAPEAPMEGEELPIVDEGPQFVTSLKMEPGWSIDAAAITWEPLAVEKINVLARNVEAANMHRKDFLCPLTVECITKADFVGHRFQMRLSEAEMKWKMSPDLVSKLRAGGNDEPKDEKHQPVPGQDRGETMEANAGDEVDPLIDLVECWVKRVLGGKARRVCALVAVEAEEIIEMDYIANRTPDGRLPFYVIRAFPVHDRWFGKGYYERFRNDQEFMDRQHNRIEWRNRYHSNPTTFWNRTAFQQGPEMGTLRLRPGANYELTKEADLTKVMQAFTLPDLDDRTAELQNLRMSVFQTRTGVTSAAQGDVSGLPSTNTATGIESILQSGSVLARQPINQVRDDITPALLYAAKLTYANMDLDEVFTYFEGDVQKAQTLEAMKVQNLDFNVHLLMTRYNDREKLESSKAAIDISNLWTLVPPAFQEPFRPLYVQALKSLGFQQADAMIKLPPMQIDPMTGLPMAPQMLPAPGMEAGQAPEPAAQPAA